MPTPLYDDGTYSVSTAIVATPRRFYPIANTTASIRRDPLWIGLAVTVLAAACLAVYGDLLHPNERIALGGVCLLALLAGSQFSVLRIAALGHHRAMIIGRRRRIARLYRAIRDARMADPAAIFAPVDSDT